MKAFRVARRSAKAERREAKQGDTIPAMGRSDDNDRSASKAEQPAVPWPPDRSERCDFYHRIRTFPPHVNAWRKALVAQIKKDPALFPVLNNRSTIEDIRSRLDDGISYLREVARITALLYGTPTLGNKIDPVDELVYIILARKTREGAYQEAFDALKSRFETWDDLLDASRKEVERCIRSGGLSDKKTLSLFGALGRIRDRFGSCTLEPTRAWTDAELEEFLCSLPEISRKSAYCVMMYAFGRSVFPVDAHVGRVLSRLGPYREFGLNLKGKDHKNLQLILADLIPPNLRHALHVNLLVHGREVCKSPRPLCDRCELRNLCATYRHAEAKRVAGSSAPVVVDLFSGAGGLSEGFVRAGFRVSLAIDNDPMATRTYAVNHPSVPDDRVLTRDITQLKRGDLKRLVGQQEVDVLIGAPPCQGFSHAGFRSKSTKTNYRISADDRNFLFEHMIAAALELRPKLFLMENVPGMQSARQENLSFLEIAANKLSAKGYKTAIWKLNASAFGVPQDRIRYFLVASRLTMIPMHPHQEYQDVHRPDFDVDALPPITLEEAIFDLPSREANTGYAVDLWEPLAAESDWRLRRYQLKFGLRRTSRLMFNHTVRYHNNRDLELYALLRPGEDSIHALERYGRHDLMRYRSDVFDDKYARLRGDRPAKTIVSHLAKDGNGYIHPTQTRSISIREAARIQSFHDGFVFCGSPSDQWVQLGNSVPPVLAERVAQSFMRLLQKKGTSK
jgi:DNA (cytosine-5)-methyltransferase 1